MKKECKKDKGGGKRNRGKGEIGQNVTYLPNLVLGDPEVTANIYCKSRNLPNTDT